MEMIKKSFLLLVMFLINLISYANVNFQFAANSISSGPIKTKMESNISNLLTEINRAATTGKPLSFYGISIEEGAIEHLMGLWDASPFVCDKNNNISKCLNDFQGYQVRAIPITMKPNDSSYDQSLQRELTISLNKKGVITGVRLAWELHEDVEKILATTGTGGVAETRMRRELLKWVEDFRCYYEAKNISALEKIYSEDALIITGSVITKKWNGGDGSVKFEKKIHYRLEDKRTYLERLQEIFRNKKYVKVGFDHVSVMKHGAKENIYGVTLHQTWETNTYQDDGWLFLLWDFNDPERPQIHVRTWQPNEAVAKDGVFTLDDFFIP